MSNAAIRPEGESGENTVLDMTEGLGSCSGLRGGTNVTIRNFHMIGHASITSMAGSFTTSSGCRFWVSHIKACIIGCQSVPEMRPARFEPSPTFN